MTRIVMTLAMLYLAAPAFGQNRPNIAVADTVHYPKLIQAELPLYPPIAWTAHVTGTVEIQVTVEKGSVVDAQVKSVEIQIIGPDNPPKNDAQTKLAVSPYISNPALANVKTWQFQSEDRATFLVKYAYQIEGEQTPLPENPRVELDLPRSVKVTAKPFKPASTPPLPRGVPVP